MDWSLGWKLSKQSSQIKCAQLAPLPEAYRFAKASEEAVLLPKDMKKRFLELKACLQDKMLSLQRKILMPDISIVGENIEESWKAVRMMENTGSLAVSVLNMKHSTSGLATWKR